MNIVLVHGILGFSHLDVPLFPIDYFSGVAAFLRERFRAAVFAPAVDPTAGIEKRSEMLRASIETALTKGELQPTESIHIIAHSMGGLDSRRMICKGRVIEANGEKTVIQTLSTIGTPHRGSPVADLVALTFLDRIPFLAEAVKEITVIANQYIIWNTPSEPTVELNDPDARFPVAFTSTELADRWVELKPPLTMGWIDFTRYTPQRMLAAEQIRRS